jgi:hypothetical protein
MVYEFELNRKTERMFNLSPRDMYCNDFSPEKLPRSKDNPQPIPMKTIGYSIQNSETHERRYITSKQKEIIYNKDCKGCIIYNEETEEQKIVSQKEFEQTFFKWNTDISKK